MNVFKIFPPIVFCSRATPPIGALVLVLGMMVGTQAAESSDGVSLRCGWFDNPSPGNAWLHDRDGEWAISIQGQRQAEGRWPKFKDSQWVQTGSGSSGYGCACLKVQTNAESREILKILVAYSKPLSACRRDKTLKEPANPLADS